MNETPLPKMLWLGYWLYIPFPFHFFFQFLSFISSFTISSLHFSFLPGHPGGLSRLGCKQCRGQCQASPHWTEGSGWHRSLACLVETYIIFMFYFFCFAFFLFLLPLPLSLFYILCYSPPFFPAFSVYFYYISLSRSDLRGG